MEAQLPFRAQMVALAGCVLLFLLVLELVRRRRLKEEYSILWMSVSLGMAVLAAWGGLLIGITRLVGASSANSVIFFFAILFLMALVLHLTMRVSGLTEHNKELAQELALLAQRFDEIAAPRSDGEGRPASLEGPSAPGPRAPAARR